jgi:hypothetical protein
VIQVPLLLLSSFPLPRKFNFLFPVLHKPLARQMAKRNSKPVEKFILLFAEAIYNSS